jgi:hypothetical protein
MTPAFPPIGIRDGIEVIEIDEAIRATVHHCERDGRAGVALRLLSSDAVNAFPSTLFLYCDCESDFSSDDARNPVPAPGTCTTSAATGRAK